MFRRPVVWIVFVAVAAACGVFSYVNFSAAFPIVSVDLSMDREAALDRARELAETYDWGPEGYREAASFGGDSRTQSFVELEGGGKEAFAEMLRQGLYSAFQWRVRHFKQGQTNEVTIRFTPAGEPYGFTEKLAEDAPGPSLPPGEARTIAESTATGDWGIDLSAYDLVEQAQEDRPGGRTDHTFTYELRGASVGEGRYRLRLVAGGDRLTELTHFVKIPEAFERRYEEMRSANNAIGLGSAVAMVVLYFIGGCGIGLFFLLRLRWVLWRKAVLWGFFISFLQGLVIVNQWPLTWMGYDTALSVGTFVFQTVLQALAQFFGMGVLLSVSFMAAESLTRRAFPHHIQLWRTWRRSVAGSPAVLGRTAAGYLLVAVFMAYEVVLYRFAQDALGWWSPSDALFDPDVLAGFMPWLSSIAVSLQAGFWEECLFRAVPLACAALIGQRLGGRRWWILGALLVEAVVFGSGHAAYATQPSYARVVELILPAIGFGVIYLVWGLLPSIVLHFTFDVVWFSLPLFVSSAPGVWIQRVMVVLLVLVPLWVVLGSRLRNTRWTRVGEVDLNGAWSPPPAAAPAPAPQAVERAVGLSPRLRAVLLALGAVGLATWALTARFTTDAPPLPVTRTQALDAARAGLAARGVDLKPPWREMSAVQADTSDADRFVWQEGGAEAYHDLLGRYLPPPRWNVRYARFEGDVAERAEEYDVWVDASGEATRFRHVLPEAAPGANLDEDAARVIAERTIAEVHGLDPASLKEISAEPSKLPNRTDWTFTYSDPAGYPLDEGEARVGVDLAGDEVAFTYRFIHVPESWQRAERDRGTARQAVHILCAGGLALIFLAGLVGAVVMWSRKRFAVGAFLAFGGLLFAVNGIRLADSWPSVEFAFSTAQPFTLQLATFAIGGLMSVLVMAGAIGMNVGLAHRWLPAARLAGRGSDLLAGVGLGGLVSGALALGASLAPAVEPSWPDFGGASAVVPALAAAVGPIGGAIVATTLVLLVFAAADRFTAGWTRRRGALIAPCVAFGLLVAGSRSVDSIWLWLPVGAIAGLAVWAAYAWVLRHDWSLIPPAVATVTLLAALRAGIVGAWPGVLAGSTAAALLLSAVGVSWFRTLCRRRSD